MHGLTVCVKKQTRAVTQTVFCIVELTLGCLQYSKRLVLFLHFFLFSSFLHTSPAAIISDFFRGLLWGRGFLRRKNFFYPHRNRKNHLICISGIIPDRDGSRKKIDKFSRHLDFEKYPFQVTPGFFFFPPDLSSVALQQKIFFGSGGAASYVLKYLRFSESLARKFQIKSK